METKSTIVSNDLIKKSNKLDKAVLNPLSDADLQYLVIGATFYASGGGGGMGVTQKFANQIIADSRTVYLVDIPSVNEVHFNGAVIAAVGSPDKLVVNGVGQSPTQAAELLQTEVGFNHWSYFLTVEIGANIFVAMMAALDYDVPLVDCDGCGRAVPTLSCLTYSASGINSNPFALVNIPNSDSGIGLNKITMYPDSVDDASALVRPIISTPVFSGGIAGLASWYMNGATLNSSGRAVAGSIKRAIILGANIKALQARYPSGGLPLITSIISLFAPGTAKILFHGTVIKVSEVTKNGFDFGTVQLQDLDGTSNTITINNQNENIIAYHDQTGNPIMMFPDLITYVKPNGNPTTNSDNIQKGDELYIVAMKADPLMLAPNIAPAEAAVRELAGYTGPYIPYS